MSPTTRPLNRYRYDALDRLVELEPLELEKLTRFYRGEHLVTQLKGQDAYSVLQHDRQLLAVQSSDGAERNSLLLVTDQQRSVLQMTGPDAGVRQVYAPYGHRRVENGPGGLLGFTGEVVDPATGHYLLGNGHRAFNPVLMRFNRPDSLSPFGRGGLNAYAYCLGDPVNFSDPTGQFARLITSLFSVANARITMSPAIPFKLAKDALQWGAAGRLPYKYTLGAAGSTVAGVATMASALTGVAGAVAGITGDSESAKTLGFIALGLAGLTVVSRATVYWAARDPKTVPALKRFVERRKRPVALSLPAAQPPDFPIPSAPPLSPGTPQPSAPLPTPRPVGFEGFGFPAITGRTVNFLNAQLNRQPDIFRNAKYIRRHSL
ncbi:RHS repeat-associated core domain-containing protein [Pseudomonas sp. BF-R-24]|uniref:RHS repeat-associated core domain-containing protein n=1 Tax=Pseudomonas sp. BF-R-24 TaxID=2832386 RepID=UPI001CBB74C2|nr:RHS repeat-associated core domain-containing protein [Pseudomonas sp. BF-R-24]